MNESTKTLPEFKKCPKCGLVKHRSEYAAVPSRSNGWSSYCKVCLVKYSKKYLAKQKRQEGIKQQKAVFYKAKQLGVSIKFADSSKKWGTYRNTFSYHCPQCGAFLTGVSAKQALESKFLCPHCLALDAYQVSKVSNKPYVSTTNPLHLQKIDSKCTKKHCTCEKDVCKAEEHHSGSTPNFALENILKQHKNNESCTVFGFNNHPIRVIMIPMYDSFSDKIKQEQKKENRFIKWLKGLFGK